MRRAGKMAPVNDENEPGARATRHGDDEPAPVEVLERAASCVRFVMATLKIELDFSPDTLPLVDHWLASARELDSDAADEAQHLAAEAAGAYLGEVVRRSLAGFRWHLDRDTTRWRLEHGSVFLSFNPLGMAEEAVLGEPLEGWNAHLEVLPEDARLLEQTLARLGDVREDDYYRLAVRWEVVEQALEALAAAKLARGDERRYGPDIYRAALDGLPPSAKA
jgi:hypothetical protein